MKVKSLITLLLLTTLLATYAQDARDILKKSYHKCQSIQSGYYQLDSRMKYMTNNDTVKNYYECYFKKTKEDTIFSFLFHNKYFNDGKNVSEIIIYTGDDLIITNVEDSTSTIMNKAKWAAAMKYRKSSYNLYPPLMKHNSSPLPNDSALNSNKRTFKFIGVETINNLTCYHIQSNEIPENDTTELMKFLNIEHHYWINKTDNVPIQYSTTYHLLMNNDTMCQYEINTLKKYELNNLKDKNIFTMKTIPSYYKIKDFVPYKSPEPLPKDTIAPTWKLLSLTDEEVSLDNLKGNLVLLDFFYQSCYPCMLALPALQNLHDKYKDKGLKVIGINPYDKKEDNIAAFLAKRGINYTVLLGAEKVADDYRVSGYPTLFLIDKNGMIIFIQEGYGKNTEQVLEEIILKNL